MITEESLPPYRNLKPTFPYPPTPRSVFTPTIFRLDEHLHIRKLEGIRISPSSEEKLECEPKSVEDKLNYILKAGTSYIPCSPKFLDLFVKEMPQDNLRQLTSPTLGKNYHYHDFIINLYSGVLRVQKGNKQHGRVYSFWDAYPSYLADQLSEIDPEPLDLDDFYKIFMVLMLECAKHGLDLSTLVTAASVAQTYLLRVASSMFGHLDEIDPSIIEFAKQCYKGSRFEATYSGSFEGFYYDIISAYPSVIAELIPCFGPGVEWFRDNHYHPEAFYGFTRSIVRPTITTVISPTVLRYSTLMGNRLAGLACTFEGNIAKPELDMYKRTETADYEILDGWWCREKYQQIRPLRDPMRQLNYLRSNPILGRLVKLVSQTIYGKMSSTWEEFDLEPVSFEPLTYAQKVTTRTSPLFQLIYASHITSYIRAAITELAMEYKGIPRADGIITQLLIPDDRLSDKPGGLKLKNEGKQLVVDDMLYGLDFLDMLLKANPKSNQYIYPAQFVTSIRGASLSTSSLSWPKNVGRSGVKLITRTIGSHKRIPTTLPYNVENLLRGPLESRPPRNLNDLAVLKAIADPFDFG